MKLVQITARQDRAGKHNDRNFNLNNAKHINQDKCSENKYYTYNGCSNRKFCDIELDYYKEHFAWKLEQDNQHRKETGHPERIRKMSDIYKQKRYRPEDMIIQIGTRDDHVSGEELWEVAQRYREQFESLYGENCKILTMALHMDEETPHVHIRRVWQTRDEENRLYISQQDALETLGFTKEDQDMQDGRFNNSKKSFSRTDRQMLRKIVEELGIDIEPDRHIPQEHLSTAEYKVKKELEKLEKYREEAEYLRQEAMDLKEENQKLQEEKEALEDEVDNIEMLYDFLEDQGMLDEYERYRKRQKNKETAREDDDDDLIGF